MRGKRCPVALWQAAALLMAACAPAASSPPASNGDSVPLTAGSVVPEADLEIAAPPPRRTPPAEPGDCTGPLTFADEQFERAVRFRLKKPVGDVLPADVTELGALGVLQSGIRELGGAECLSGLTRLDLRGQVSDLTPLAGLTNLTTLHVSDTKVSDLRPLAGLTSLTMLELNSTQVSDLKPLARLSKLQEVSLVRTPVRDLRPLARLSELKLVSVFGSAFDCAKQKATVKAFKRRGCYVSCSYW